MLLTIVLLTLTSFPAIDVILTEIDGDDLVRVEVQKDIFCYTIGYINLVSYSITDDNTTESKYYSTFRTMYVYSLKTKKMHKVKNADIENGIVLLLQYYYSTTNPNIKYIAKRRTFYD